MTPKRSINDKHMAPHIRDTINAMSRVMAPEITYAGARWNCEWVPEYNRRKAQCQKDGTAK